MSTVTAEGEVLTDEHIEAVRRELVETDGEPLESPWHRASINLLIEILLWRSRGRTDYFVGGNMFIYYSLTQVRHRQYKGPDFFFVDHVEGTRKRDYWWVFEEDGRFPDTIIELTSPTTAETDHTTKKDLYERVFRTPEYFCYDPATHVLEGWRLTEDRYRAIQPNERGWLWSERLQLWLGTWQGEYLGVTDTWLRYYDQAERLLLTEAQDKTERLAAVEQELKQMQAKLHANGQQT